MIGITADALNDAIEQSQLKISNFSDSLEMRRICKRVSQRLAANGWEPCLGSLVATKMYGQEEHSLGAYVIDRGDKALVLALHYPGYLRDRQEFEVSIPKVDDATEIRSQVSKFVFKIEQRFEFLQYCLPVKSNQQPRANNAHMDAFSFLGLHTKDNGKC